MDIFAKVQRDTEMVSRWSSANGKYYKAMNGTPGTAISSGTNVAFSVNSALLDIENPNNIYPNNTQNPSVNNQPSDPIGAGSIFIYPHYFRVNVAGAGTSTTSLEWAITIDPKSRFSSGGFQPISPEFGPENVLVMNSTGFMPTANIHVGAVTTNAAGANRLLAGRGTMRTGLPVVGDEYLWTFGDVQATSGPKAGTTAQIIVENIGPVCIPPGSSFVLYTWYPAMATAFTFEFELAWWEKQWGL
jgi:hypothetical protein